MKTSIRFRLNVTICVAILFTGAISYISVTTRAEGGYAEAKKAAQDAVAKALELAKKCKELGEAAEKLGAADTAANDLTNEAGEEARKAEADAKEAMEKAGVKRTKQDDAADEAALAADTAATDADIAMTQGHKDAKKEAAAAAKEAASDKANKEAAKADEQIGDAEVRKAKENARKKRKDARAEARRAMAALRKAIDAREAAKKACKDAEEARAAAEESLRKAEELLAEKSEESGNKPPKKLVEEKKKLDELRKDLQGNVIPASADQANVVTKSTDGIRVITFNTSAGQIVVNLPDDMRAGDTISGTVVAEPKGSTDQERNKNMAELSGYVVELQTPKPRNDGDKKPTPTIVKWIDKASPDLFLLNLPDTKIGEKLLDVNLRKLAPGERSKFGAPNYFPLRENETAPGKLIATDLPVHIEYHDNPIWYTGVINDFNIPKIVQQGRLIEIIGPFDGDSSNTALKSSVQDFEKGTENVSGGFGLIRPLVESPRRTAFRNSTNVTGPIELTLNEANKETKGTYRNVGVKLTAPKTNLLKGEQTTLTVEVNGLQGTKSPVPLTLESKGVITMDGGMYQPLTIQPSQVGPDGRYTTTRGITGVQAGGWTATATVVTGPFNVCLQDDTQPATVVLWNTFTGDSIFSTPQAGKVLANRVTLTSLGRDYFSLARFSLARKGTVAMKGCVITLTHNAPDRRVMSRLDVCNNTGTASVQTNSPKTSFTITDRNTANNVCPSIDEDDLEKWGDRWERTR